MLKKLIALFKWLFVLEEPTETYEEPTAIRVVQNIRIKCVEDTVVEDTPSTSIFKEMTYTEWKHQNKQLDAYFNSKNKTKLRLVA